MNGVEPQASWCYLREGRSEYKRCRPMITTMGTLTQKDYFKHIVTSRCTVLSLDSFHCLEVQLP